MPGERAAEKAGLTESTGRPLDLRNQLLELRLWQLAGERAFELDRQGPPEQAGDALGGDADHALIELGGGATQMARVDARLRGDLLQVGEREAASFGG